MRGEHVELRRREFDLLAFLCASPRQVFTSEQLLRHVWDSEPEWQGVGTVSEHVHRLRAKVEMRSRRAVSHRDRPRRRLPLRPVALPIERGASQAATVERRRVWTASRSSARSERLGDERRAAQRR